MEAVQSNAPLWREGEYTILTGDGVKQAKEGKRMPGVKKQYQESENSSKPEYIFGHMFGGIGILSENIWTTFCIPLYINLQDGIQTILSWGKEGRETVPFCDKNLTFFTYIVNCSRFRVYIISSGNPDSTTL